MTNKAVRIGGASAYMGDSAFGAMQLSEAQDVHYLAFDFMSEITMPAMAMARQANPEAGYASNFVNVTIPAIAARCRQKGIRLVANAGGVNPLACARAVEARLAELGVELSVAVVHGDDILDLAEEDRETARDFYSGGPMPAGLLSANAYLGALPIAQALELGADIVITGRVVDSACTLGILMHEFGWKADEYDKLAAGSLAGHLIECGAQATGGLFTDWEQVPDWANIGYPIVACQENGEFVVTKPEGTGGLVTTATVAEQLVYEIGDPAAYILPDVVCDFTAVRLEQTARDCVRVIGTRGRAPTPTYKVSATYRHGYRATVALGVVGIEACAKARRTGEALLARASAMLQRENMAPFSESLVSVIGAEEWYGPHGRDLGLRDAVARVAVCHETRAGATMLAREAGTAGVSWAPGTSGGVSGRGEIAPETRLFSWLVPKERVASLVFFRGETLRIEVPQGQALVATVPSEPTSATGVPATGVPATGAPAAEAIEVPLVRLAWGRSGDKGTTSNIGVVARSAAIHEFLKTQLTETVVAEWLGHLVHGKTYRYELPGLQALNFLLEESLDGGGTSTLRMDPLGKCMAQVLLSMPMRVPAHLLASVHEAT